MVDPINYSGLMSQLDFRPLQQGLQIRDNRNQEAEARRDQQAVRQLAVRKFEVEQQADQDYMSAVEAYKADPTPGALRDLGIRFPEKAKALMEAGDSYTTTQKRDLIGAGFSALGALSANKTDLAVQTLEDRVTALKGSGVDTSHTQAAIKMIRDGDIKGATSYLSYAMSGLVGADHAAGVMETLGIGKKAEDRQNDNERAERKLELDERRISNTERATTAAIAGRARDDARADRKAAGGGGTVASGQYEYRVDPKTGAVQRRKKP